MFIRRQKLPLTHRMKYAMSPPKGHKRTWRYVIWRLKRMPGTPEYIATGFAIGIAVNFWPILFTHLIIGYILCRIIKASLLSMFIGTMFGNPWTFAIVYPLMYKIGKVLLGLKIEHHTESINSASEVMDKIWPIETWAGFLHALQEVILPMMLGGFLLGLPCTIAAYYFARKMIRAYQAQKRKNLQEQFNVTETDIEQPHPETETV